MVYSTRSNVVCSDQTISSGDVTLDGMVVYPNPATSRIFIRPDGCLKHMDLRILTPEGRCLIEKSGIPDGAEIDISTLKDG